MRHGSTFKNTCYCQKKTRVRFPADPTSSGLSGFIVHRNLGKMAN